MCVCVCVCVCVYVYGDIEMAEESDIKLPTSVGSSKKQ